MEQRLFNLLIFTGFLDLALCDLRAYKLILTPLTWTEAQTYCRTKYIDLATTESTADLLQLQTLARENQFTSTAWIGLYRPWRWSMTNESLGPNKFWAPGEPDPVGTSLECAIISAANKGWVDYPCSNMYSYVCYDANNPSATRYVYYSTTMTWYNALSYCRQHHTDLANPTDATENVFILGKITKDSWIGLIRDIWRWSDNSSVPVVGWASGQPNSALKVVHCAYFSNGQLTNNQCTNTMAFFCSHVLPVRQQIVKLKVQSDQDMNSPQVEAQILQQVQDCLSTHGMENFTVKFTKHQDEMVFHNAEYT